LTTIEDRLAQLDRLNDRIEGLKPLCERFETAKDTLGPLNDVERLKYSTVALISALSLIDRS
jgi:hypothetical protein